MGCLHKIADPKILKQIWIEVLFPAKLVSWNKKTVRNALNNKQT